MGGSISARPLRNEQLLVVQKEEESMYSPGNYFVLDRSCRSGDGHSRPGGWKRGFPCSQTVLDLAAALLGLANKNPEDLGHVKENLKKLVRLTRTKNSLRISSKLLGSNSLNRDRPRKNHALEHVGSRDALDDLRWQRTRTASGVYVRARTKGAKLRRQTTLCGFLRVPADLIVSCKDLRFDAKTCASQMLVFQEY